MNEVHEQIGTLEQRFRRFRITGSPDVIIEGDIYHGYAVNVPQCGAAAAGVTGACCFPGGGCSVETEAQCITDGGTYQGDGTGCFPNPCPTDTGACCFEDGTCSIETSAQCATDGGTYQGDGTTCSPNPCPQPPSGACCHDTSCDIETESDCTESGGTYQGDGTTCDPNPCETPPCDFDCGGFFNPDDGMYYNKKIYTNTPVTLCPGASTWLQFSTGFWINPADCSISPFHAPDCFTLSSRSASYLTQQTYDADCNLVEAHENIDIHNYCNCVDPAALFNIGVCFGAPDGVLIPNCPLPSPGCICGDVPQGEPPYFIDCTSVNTVVSYAEPCIP